MLSVVGRLISLGTVVIAAAAASPPSPVGAAVVPLGQAQGPAAPPAAPEATAPATAAEEPPARVGRVGIVDGNLAFHLRGETRWSAAGVNYPVATGATFWTDPQSRAEIQIGPSTLDLAADTQLDIVTLNQEVAEFGLPKGQVRLRLRQLDEGQSVAVDLPRGGVWMLQPGEYEIDAGAAGQPSRVAVFAGSARFVGNGADTGIKAGQVAVLSGTSPVVAKLESATAPDRFLGWCRSHDYAENRLVAPYYVSPQMTGYAALDQYGSWAAAGDYGPVWYPNVPAGWVPYSVGLWSWIGPWGWTWIDSEPWGFAPFHYGRWAYIGGRWGWVPGRFVARPVYAPALVAFVGGRGLDRGRGVGWFPLGPGEAYWPRYTRDRDYIRRLNAGDVGDIDRILRRGPAFVARGRFANRRFAVAVPARVFAGARPVGPDVLHLRPAAAARARVAIAPPHLRPPRLPETRAVAAAAGRLPANAAALPPLRPAARIAPAAGARRLPAPPHAVSRPMQAFHAPVRPPVRVFGAPVHAARTAVSVFHGPVHAFHAPMQAFHAPPPAFHAPPAMFHTPAPAARGIAGFGGGAPHPAAAPHPAPAAAPQPGGGKDHH